MVAGKSNQVIAAVIANSIKEAIDTKAGRISKAQITTSFQLHLVLEAVATSLDVDVAQFKINCGVGQPLAYFI